MDFKPDHAFADYLDENDILSSYRTKFNIFDPELIYLDGNSLGRQPKASVERLQELSLGWGRDLIGGFNADWWHAPQRVGDKIAPLVRAEKGQMIVCDTVSLNLYKLATAALVVNRKRKKIVTDALNFPSDLYILQGLIRLVDGTTITRIGSTDGDITPDLEALEKAIDDDTALVTLSHVTFKSGYLYDMEEITKLAHQRGSFVLWDLSHSVGAVPIELDTCNVDFAIGCTYKYLNGGPGSPAFLYVRKDLQEKIVSPICGWWGQKDPFNFELEYKPAHGICRFLSGSQPIISLLTMEASLTPLLEAGIDNIRKKSLLLSEYFIFLCDHFLAPLGFTFGSPRCSARRGSHVSLRHPEGYRINRALIDEMNVIPDFREPDNLRFGLTPLYTTFHEIWESVNRIRIAVTDERYKKYSTKRLTVT
jgi:kynureninase